MNKIESPEFVEECLTLADKAPYSWNLRADLCDINTKDGFLASALEVIPRLARSHKALAEKHGKLLALSMRQMSELHSEIADLLTALAEANAQVFALLDEQTTTEADRAEWKEAWWRQRDATGRAAWEALPEAQALRTSLAEANARIAELEAAK